MNQPSCWHRGLASAFCCLWEFALAFGLSCSQGSRAQELHRGPPEPGTLLLIILVISFVLNDIFRLAFAFDFVRVRILLTATGRSVAKDSQENSSFCNTRDGSSTAKDASTTEGVCAAAMACGPDCLWTCQESGPKNGGRISRASELERLGERPLIIKFWIWTVEAQGRFQEKSGRKHVTGSW